MIALLKKDWRENRVLVIGSLVMVAIPYAIVLVARLFTSPRTPYAGQFNDSIEAAGFFGLWLTALISTAFGGAAFAHERRERSADFLAMLPATRSQIVISKFVVAVGWLLLVWSANLVLVLLANSLSPASGRPRISIQGGLWKDALTSATAAMMFFGVAWFLSTFLTSPSISAIVSLGATVALMLTVALLVDRANPGPSARLDDAFRRLVDCLTASIGLVALVAGTVYYLLRIEP